MSGMIDFVAAARPAAIPAAVPAPPPAAIAMPAAPMAVPHMEQAAKKGLGGIGDIFRNNPWLTGVLIIALAGLLFFALSKVLAMQRRVKKLESRPPVDEASVRDITREEMQTATREAEQRLRGEMHNQQRRFASYMEEQLGHANPQQTPQGGQGQAQAQAQAQAPNSALHAQVHAQVQAPSAPEADMGQMPSTFSGVLPSKPWLTQAPAPAPVRAPVQAPVQATTPDASAPVQVAGGISFPPPRPLPAMSLPTVSQPTDEDKARKRTPLTMVPAAVGIAPPSHTQDAEREGGQQHDQAPEDGPHDQDGKADKEDKEDKEEESEDEAAAPGMVEVGGIPMPAAIAGLLGGGYDDAAGMLGSATKRGRGGKVKRTSGKGGR